MATHAKKSLLFFFFFTLILCNFFSASLIQPNLTQNQDNRLKSDEGEYYGGELETYLNYTDAGDFLDWDVIYPVGSGGAISDTGDKFRIQTITYISAKRPLPQVSTDFARYYGFYIEHERYWAYPYASASRWEMRVYYTDGTYTEIYYSPYGGDLDWAGWLTGVFPIGKTLDYVWVYLEGAGTGYGCYVNITDEVYLGYSTEISNVSYSDYIKTWDTALFSIDCSQIVDANITFTYLETQQSKIIEMTQDWAKPLHYYAQEQFSQTGLYSFNITVKNVVNVTTTTPYFVFEVMDDPYPHSSYLSVFSSLDGFPIDKDFKVYVGEDEEQSLVNFVDYFGNWSRIFGSSIINASLIDNYITFQAQSNGLATRFENDSVVNTLIYNTLLFEIRVENSLWLNLMYNPDLYEKGYYIQFNESQVGYWYSVEVPIFNWTVYKDVTNDRLYELGFWISSGTISLANIRLARHYDANIYNQTNAYTEIQRIQGNPNWTQTSEWLNQSLWLNQSYSLTSAVINTSQIQESNITSSAVNMSSLDTGHYSGAYSFTYDAIGGDPADWAVTESAGTHVDVAAGDSHQNIVEIWDDNAVGLAKMSIGVPNVADGTVEFWIKSTLGTGGKNILYIVTRKTGAIAWVSNVDIDATQRLANDRGGAGSDVIVADPNFAQDTWQHVRIEFHANGGVGSTIKYWVNGTYIGEYAWWTAQTYIDQIDFYTENAATFGNVYHRFDAIDFSWADGYYTNRNLNDSVPIDFAINATSQFNFSKIELDNVYALHLDANFDQNYVSAASSVEWNENCTPESSGEDFSHVQTHTNDSTYYNVAGINETNIVDANITLAYNLTSYQFNSIRIDISYLAGWTSGPYYGKNGSLSLYNNENSSYVILDYVNALEGRKNVSFVIENITPYLNATHFLNLYFYTGFSNWLGSLWIFGMKIYYAAITFYYDDLKVGVYNFTSEDFDYYAFTGSFSNYEFDYHSYFNSTNVIIRVNMSNDCEFDLFMNLSLSLTYFYYENATYIYYFDLTESNFYFYEEFILNYTSEINTTANFYWGSSSDNTTFSEWNDSLSIAAYQARYLAIRIDLNTTYICNTSIFYEFDFLYEAEHLTYFYVLNYTATLTFDYNSSDDLISTVMDALALNLTVINTTAYQLFAFNFTSESYVEISAFNYTNSLISSNFYNLTQFQIQFFINTTITYTFAYDANISRYYREIWNVTAYIADFYRLISPENRQNPNEMIFDSEYQTLAILDYFDNVLYRERVQYQPLIDVGLPISSLIVVNNYNYTLLVKIERGLGVYVQLVLAPESSQSIRIFATNYRIEARNLELQLLNLTSISPNSSRSVTVEFGERQTVEIPTYDFWGELIKFLFTTPHGFMLVLVILTCILLLIGNFLLNLKKKLKKSKKIKWEAPAGGIMI